jgi:hypothetical protein
VWSYYATKNNIPKVLGPFEGLGSGTLKDDEICQQTKDHFGRKCIPMQLPVNSGLDQQ